jgi:hypothetical protein
VLRWYQSFAIEEREAEQLRNTIRAVTAGKIQIKPRMVGILVTKKKKKKKSKISLVSTQ